MARRRARRRSQRLSTGHGRSGGSQPCRFLFRYRKGPFGREDDTIGIGFAYTRIGGAAGSLDADTMATTPAYPGDRAKRCWRLATNSRSPAGGKLQPDFQYIFNPGGGIPNPNAPARRIGDAAVLGLRTTIMF
jgi:porin